MKTIVTSDIHGCSREFSALLRKAKLDRKYDRLVILGDLFDRGERSYEVFQTIIRLRDEMGERLILVRGNHDQFLLEYARQKTGMRLWQLNGGRKTLESFERHGGDLLEAADLIEAMPLYYACDDFIGVHAGLIDENPENNSEEILLWDRSVTSGSYQGRLAIGGHTPVREPVWFLPDGSHLVLQYDTELPLPDRGFICIDTGCVFGYKLTALVIENNAFRLCCMKKLAY